MALDGTYADLYKSQMELENYSNPQRKAFYGTEADQEGKTILKNKG